MAGHEEFLPDQEATEGFGERLAVCCRSGLLIFLHGHLGAGKTTLVRGFLRACGYAGRVKSPTYTLVEPYSIALRNLFHLDLYRLSDAEELEWIGIRDVLDNENICLVEWPEQGAGILPEPDLHVYLHMQDSGRVVRIESSTPRGARVLQCQAESLRPA
ncbi:MAG: tRNA (adenosine(37)-N6)-threonylcarbamoyltransferase complex ATPase subunit type 1 TsaE [Gammaproteobacteria bacterium]|nr:MAG: tRNA (adenosine(37)-N6)-threonylcarbamoyltransferase complex ATPase subunit type 1 TsaE [Gammaproteobacteria bacterium]